jgi:hypothetical protein
MRGIGGGGGGSGGGGDDVETPMVVLPAGDPFLQVGNVDDFIQAMEDKQRPKESLFSAALGVGTGHSGPLHLPEFLGDGPVTVDAAIRTCTTLMSGGTRDVGPATMAHADHTLATAQVHFRDRRQDTERSLGALLTASHATKLSQVAASELRRAQGLVDCMAQGCTSAEQVLRLHFSKLATLVEAEAASRAQQVRVAEAQMADDLRALDGAAETQRAREYNVLQQLVGRWKTMTTDFQRILGQTVLRLGGSNRMVADALTAHQSLLQDTLQEMSRPLGTGVGSAVPDGAGDVLHALYVVQHVMDKVLASVRDMDTLTGATTGDSSVPTPQDVGVLRSKLDRVRAVLEKSQATLEGLGGAGPGGPGPGPGPGPSPGSDFDEAAIDRARTATIARAEVEAAQAHLALLQKQLEEAEAKQAMQRLHQIRRAHDTWAQTCSAWREATTRATGRIQVRDQGLAVRKAVIQQEAQADLDRLAAASAARMKAARAATLKRVVGALEDTQRAAAKCFETSDNGHAQALSIDRVLELMGVLSGRGDGGDQVGSSFTHALSLVKDTIDRYWAAATNLAAAHLQHVYAFAMVHARGFSGEPVVQGQAEVRPPPVF